MLCPGTQERTGISAGVLQVAVQTQNNTTGKKNRDQTPRRWRPAVGVVRHPPTRPARPNPALQRIWISNEELAALCLKVADSHTPPQAQAHKKGRVRSRGSSPAGTVDAQDDEGCQRPPTVICSQVLSRKVVAFAPKELVGVELLFASVLGAGVPGASARQRRGKGGTLDSDPLIPYESPPLPVTHHRKPSRIPFPTALLCALPRARAL